ncbi:MAG: hypothetical protein CMJ24_03620 [Phycisphaerae bacterium]|nr:hypothetical protein [Phycisphaerae bacterium]
MSDLHLTNARIWTADPARPTASAITIRSGRITAIDEAPNGEPVIDCGGDVVTPGLIDAHLHLLLGGDSLETLDLSNATSRDEFEALIAEADRTAAPDAWIIGNGWTQDNWAENHLPDMDWLRAAGSRPVVCWRTDWHAALVNQPVLDRCRLPDDAQLQAEGGRQVRHPDGRPTGLLLEAAAWNHLQPVIPKPSTSRRRTHLLNAQRHAHRFGITAVRTMEYAADILDVYQPMRDQLTMRCSLVVLDRELPLQLDWIDDFVQDDRLFISGCKTFIDGTIGSRSARMLEDWADRPGDRGMLVELALEGQLDRWIASVHAAGLDAAAHAIGDEATRIALNLSDQAVDDRRLTIEHAEVVHPDDVARVEGTWLSMQPLHRADDARNAPTALGPDRTDRLAPFRRLQEAGAHLAFGSDWPIVSCDPMLGMHAATTGHTIDHVPFHPEQAIDAEAALVAYTRDAAACCRLADCGVLRVGAHGDCVRWNGDPMQVAEESRRPSPQSTISSGNVVYDDGTRSA